MSKTFKLLSEAAASNELRILRPL